MTAQQRQITHGLIFTVTLILHGLALWFIVRYTTTFPLAIDEWLSVVPRAIRLIDGDTTLADFFYATLVYQDIPPVIYLYPWTFISPNVALFNWNLQIDSFVNYTFATINIVLCVYLISREQPQMRWYLLIPITAAVLAIQQRWNLLTSFHQIHHQQLTFLLLSLVFVAHPSKKPRYLYLAFGAAFLGSLAMPHSWLTWLIVLPAMIALGYKTPWGYLGYGLGVVVTVLTLRTIPGYAVFQDNGYFVGFESSSLLADIGGYTAFLLAYLGGIFSYGETTNLMFPLFMGLFGLVLYVMNVFYLWRLVDYRRYVVVCTALMLYSGMFGSMASLSRLDQFGVRWGATHHYMSASALYWVGLSGMIALSLHHMITNQQQKRALILTNLLAIVFGVVFYTNGVIGMIRVAEEHSVWVAQQETCMVRAANGEDVGRGCEVVGGLATPEMIQTLAEYQLAGFAENR